MHSPSRTRFARVLVPLLLAAAGGCAGGRPRPPESFGWRGPLVSFSPPPSAWRREAFDDGRFAGVRFVRAGTPAETLAVADGGEAGGAWLRARVGAAGADSTAAGWTLLSAGDTTVAGLPAYRLDFAAPAGTVPQRRRREFYFESAGHLFRADYRGSERSVRVFDRVASSIAFPDSGATVVPAPLP
jgi:hypothetical protein